MVPSPWVTAQTSRFWGRWYPDQQVLLYSLSWVYLANPYSSNQVNTFRIYITFSGCCVLASKTWNCDSRQVTINLFISISGLSNWTPHTPFLTLHSQRTCTETTLQGFDCWCRILRSYEDRTIWHLHCHSQLTNIVPSHCKHPRMQHSNIPCSAHTWVCYLILTRPFLGSTWRLEGRDHYRLLTNIEDSCTTVSATCGDLPRTVFTSFASTASYGIYNTLVCLDLRHWRRQMFQIPKSDCSIEVASCKMTVCQFGSSEGSTFETRRFLRLRQEFQFWCFQFIDLGRMC